MTLDLEQVKKQLKAFEDYMSGGWVPADSPTVSWPQYRAAMNALSQLVAEVERLKQELLDFQGSLANRRYETARDQQTCSEIIEKIQVIREKELRREIERLKAELERVKEG